MKIQTNRKTATVRQVISVEFDEVGDEVYFESTKSQRAGKTAVYLAAQVTIVLEGTAYLDEGSSGDIHFDLNGWKNMIARGRKVNGKGRTADVTVHDASYIQNKEALFREVLERSGIDPISYFDVTVFRASEMAA